MPKERYHLMIADRCFDAMRASRTLPVSLHAHRFAFRLGSISPDTLFYDLPFFFFSDTGRALHRFAARAPLGAFAARLDGRQTSLRNEGLAWVLGMASHFLADELYHPVINRLAHPERGFCPPKLSAGDCHHWVESEMEAARLSLSAPPDGYAAFLREATRRSAVARISGFLHEFLKWSGAAPRAPGAGRIRYCLFWQASLLRVFAHAAAGRNKSLLMGHRATSYAGALIVPPLPVLPAVLERTGRAEPDLLAFFSDEFFDSAVNLLSGRLSELAARF
ncbi:MAG TPA: zinc dependent phospholipase C family protein [Syntrophobacter fumaroxidans]|nr:zinc dependent phospholipase C family protein [Syntrophobacter fumaroxidans]